MNSSSETSGTAVKRDLAIVVGATMVAAVASVHFDLGEVVQVWARRWETYQLDEFPGVALVAALAATWFILRRITEVRAELGRRVALERALASALEDNRRLAKWSVQVQEAERRALARELHDELGQHLNAIKLEAVSMRRCAADDAGEVRRCASAIVESADHLHAIVRDMTRSLRPAGLDELGLHAALENHVHAWRSKFGEVSVTLRTEGEVDGLGEDVNMTVYRLVQEALTNVSRHAHAREVHISLKRDERGAVRLDLSDDGSGSADPWATRGVGLIGMRERVEALGGTLSIVTSPHQGFAVCASLPASGVAA